MKIFKFGGASVKDAAGVRNLGTIVQQYGENNVVVVVSAMGKTTNALEDVVKAFFAGQTDVAQQRWAAVKQYHADILAELGIGYGAIDDLSYDLEQYLATPAQGSFDAVYDQVVSVGELMSTRIVGVYLAQLDINVRWLDARQLIRTDATFREGRVDWDDTAKRITTAVTGENVVVTQGFIGGTADGKTTTLGREGSDYTAAIFAYCLNGESVTIWKDVPGVLNADPKYFEETVLLDRLTYQDAIELAYYGATVIHPKTIKPLQNKRIPLYVRSFLKPDAPGTVVGVDSVAAPTPSFIFKVNQRLISLYPNDFSFIAEERLSQIFGRFAQAGVKINLMQNTAISFSVVVDESERVPGLIEQLKQLFRVTYNAGLELITIRNYNRATLDRVLANKELLLEQRSRNTAQLVVRNAT